MKKVAPYAGQFLLVFAAVIAAHVTITKLNKPKVAAPATANGQQ